MKKLHVVHKIDDLWIKKGKLKAYHVGTRLYFKKSDIDTLFNDPK
jgi:hypothetical protein